MMSEANERARRAGEIGRKRSEAEEGRICNCRARSRAEETQCPVEHAADCPWPAHMKQKLGDAIPTPGPRLSVKQALEIGGSMLGGFLGARIAEGLHAGAERYKAETERMAQAIRLAEMTRLGGPADPWDRLDEPARESYRAMAEAARKAMDEPEESDERDDQEQDEQRADRLVAYRCAALTGLVGAKLSRAELQAAVEKAAHDTLEGERLPSARLGVEDAER